MGSPHPCFALCGKGCKFSQARFPAFWRPIIFLLFFRGRSVYRNRRLGTSRTKRLKAMTISAIIPAYNSAAYISDAIDSILRQTRAVDEIIVVDDGSEDDTERVVKALSGNIRYHKQANRGPSAARNQGIRMAAGEWIAFLDADDQWTKDKIAEQTELLKRYPELHLIAGDMAEIGHRDELLTRSVLDKHRLLNKFQTLAGRPLPLALSALIEKNFIPTGTVLVRRDSLFEAGLFNEAIRFGEDLELWAKIAARHPIACMPEVLMLRRQHGQNATQMTGLLLQDLVEVARSLKRSIPDAMQEQGIDPSRLVAHNLNDLGYWYFSQADYAKAREVFLSSLSEAINRRAALYLASSLLPPRLISVIKKMKALAH